MLKRDPDKKEYKPYSVPRDWKCPIYTDDMDLEINCTSCWKETTFGVCYTSRQIHNEMWFGYPVCEECYNKERK